MTTIKDVAATAGVGVATVSRVLNQHPAVTTETRQRVLAAIESLDYHPNRVARALSRRRSAAIAVAVPFFTHPSSVERLQGVLAVVEDSPYEVLLYNVGQAELRRDRIASMLRRDLADGLLMVSLRLTADEERRLRHDQSPVVVVDAEVVGLTSIVVDDVAGGRLAARHLMALGHERIAYVGDGVAARLGFTSSTRRLQGFTEELAHAGIAVDDDLVRVGAHGREPARDLARDLLRRRHRPTAVFAHSDTQAIGVLEAADDLGLRVPDDVSVIGFDDIEAARFAGLTTVRQPLFESGRLGARRLLELLNGGEHRAHERVELPLEIVERRTTGPAHHPRRRAPARQGASA